MRQGAASALMVVAVLQTVAGTSVRQAPQTFRSRVDLVDLDVSVLDALRHPVTGLARENFSVFEDGKPQEVAIFEAIELPPPQVRTAEWMRDVTPDVETNDTIVNRLWVIVVDDALIPTYPYAIKTSLDVVRRAIDLLGPNDQAALVFTTDSRRAQDFTNDRTKLLVALDQFNPGWANWTPPPNWAPVNPDVQFHVGSSKTLRSIMETLVDLPRPRKALIWISPGFGLPAFDAGSKIAASQLDMRPFEIARDTLAAARSANVPIYGVSPCGLVQKDAGSTDKCSVAASGLAALQMMSAVTGGHPIVNTNEYLAGVDGIFAENSSYYVLGYYPTNTKTDGGERRLEVKVDRPGAIVRTRDSYRAPKGTPKPPKTLREALVGATALPIATNDLSLRATAASFAVANGGRTADVAVVVGVREPATAAASERTVATADLSIAAYTTEGDRKAGESTTTTVRLGRASGGEIGYEVLSRLTLPPGRFRLRIAAHDDLVDRIGTVMLDVIVPDFAKDDVSLSGLVLSPVGGLPSGRRDILADRLPLVPSSQRRFSSSDRATALLEIYQRGPTASRADVAVHVTDAKDVVRYSEQIAVPKERFGAYGSQTRATFTHELPLDRLIAGHHLFTVTVSVNGKVLRRDLQFEIR